MNNFFHHIDFAIDPNAISMTPSSILWEINNSCYLKVSVCVTNPSDFPLLGRWSICKCVSDISPLQSTTLKEPTY